MVEVNVKASYRLVHSVVPSMRERGGGAIINLSSISGLKPQAGGLLYSFTKAGLLMMTRSWAREFGPWNIRVNAIAPGLIKTDFSAYYWSDESRMKSLIGDQAAQATRPTRGHRVRGRVSWPATPPRSSPARRW